MSHHAYLFAGDPEAGIRASRAFAERSLGIEGAQSPDLIVLEYGLFSVDDSRRVAAFAAQAAVGGGRKMIVIAAGRLFHEAQNALLKLFEEPTEGTVLVLIVPAEGVLLPTLRSRLVPLPGEAGDRSVSPVAEAFLAADAAGRAKIVANLLSRAKSDKDADKQAARLEASSLVAGLTLAAYESRDAGNGPADLLLRDLDRLAPIMHERSAPLKLILEHLLLVVPMKLAK